MAKRGRPALPAAELQGKQFPNQTPKDYRDEQTESRALIVRDEGEKKALAMQLFGDNPPLYDRLAFVEQVKFYAGHLAEAAISAGRFLLMIKAHEEHGNFLVALKEIGIQPRPAQRLMQVALKFSAEKRAALAARIGTTKALELLAEDDGDIDLLADGQSVHGLILDDIDRMAPSVMRKAFRKARADLKATEDTLGDKNKKIDALDRQVNNLPEVREFGEKTLELHKQIMIHGVKMEEAVAKFHDMFDHLVAEVYESNPTQAEQESVAYSTVNAIERAIHRLGILNEQVEAQFAGFIAARYHGIKKERNGE